MEDVTDTVFRQIVASCGKPDVFFTEFTNADGLCSKGREIVAKRLIFTKEERPIVAQIWGNNPENYYKSAKLIRVMGFDGIDINMGCPDKTVVKRGLCSGLINNPSLAEEIILAAREGAKGLPISVKTRIGYKNIETKWIGFLLGLKLEAITVHARTVYEMSKVPAHWDEIGKVVKLRNSMKAKTLIIGNGDVKSIDEAQQKYKQYKVDGIMIGRGIFNNLWVFNRNINPKNIPYKEKLQLLIKHIELFDKTWGKTKNFAIMKKFYKIYISDVPDASDFRSKLMEFKTAHKTLRFLRST